MGVVLVPRPTSFFLGRGLLPRKKEVGLGTRSGMACNAIMAVSRIYIRVSAISLRSRYLGAVVILLARYTARGIYCSWTGSLRSVRHTASQCPDTHPEGPVGVISN